MAETTTKKKDNRVRNWTTILYPESLPDRWEFMLGELKIPTYVSPLHDKDVNETGEKKKAHYHVVFAFAGKKSYETVKAICNTLNGANPQPVNDLRGMLRYFLHMDNPLKAQYSRDDVKCFGGADFQKVIELASDRRAALKEMQAFCRKYQVFNYALFADYCAEHRADWYNILIDHNTVHMKEYLKSLKWGIDTEQSEHIVDLETGDIIF